MNPLTCPTEDLPRLAAEAMGKELSEMHPSWRGQDFFEPHLRHDHAAIVRDVVPKNNRYIFLKRISEILIASVGDEDVPDCLPPSDSAIACLWLLFATPEQITRAAIAALQGAKS